MSAGYFNPQIRTNDILSKYPEKVEFKKLNKY